MSKKIIMAIFSLLCATSIGLVGCNKPSHNSKNENQNSESYTESQSHTLESNSVVESEKSSDLENKNSITVISPSGIVYPYHFNAKSYLNFGGEVADYFNNSHTPNVPITIKWEAHG